MAGVCSGMLMVSCGPNFCLLWPHGRRAGDAASHSGGHFSDFSKDWLLADNPGLVPDLQPLLHFALNGECHDYASYFTGDRLEDFRIADGEIDD